MTRIIPAILAVMMAACTGAPAQVEPAPRFGVAVPTATPASASVAMMDAQRLQTTAEARMFEAQRQAAEATAQVAAVTANARATGDAYAFRATSTADALAMLQQQDAATATAQAAIGQATSEAQATAFAAVASRDAYAMSQDRAEAEATRKADQRNRDNVRAWGITTVLIVFIVAAAAVTVVSLRGIFDAVQMWIKARAFREAMMESSGGVIQVTAGSMDALAPRYLPEPPRAPLPVPPKSDVRSIPINEGTGGYVEVEDNSQAAKARRDAMHLLFDSIIWQKQTGAAVNRVPSHNQLEHFSSSTWQQATAPLKAVGAIYSEAGSGTWAAPEWGSLERIYQALKNKDLDLSHPAPNGQEAMP